MEIGADISHGAHSAVPSGLRQSQISVPNVETLGYSRLSLRDKGSPWSGASFMGSNLSGIRFPNLLYRRLPSRQTVQLFSNHAAQVRKPAIQQTWKSTRVKLRTDRKSVVQ